MSPDRLGVRTTRVLMAVMRQAHPTWRSVALEAGVGSGTITHHLHRLRAAGLVVWEPGAQGTLRATVSAHRPEP